MIGNARVNPCVISLPQTGILHSFSRQACFISQQTGMSAVLFFQQTGMSAVPVQRTFLCAEL